MPDRATPRVAVVIPYFQRTPGILARALRSVQAQRGVEPPLVLVVDDASPAPARAEIAAGAFADPAQVRVLERANGGPAAARNTGLDAVPAGTEFVAFLDSDDEWMPDHLARALTALDQGYDFYFANFFQLDQQVGAFERTGHFAADAHPPLAGPPDLHVYAGDLFNQTIVGNLIGTPTVCYRLACAPRQRFREEFVHAGEDYLFWLDLVQAGARVAFSTQPEVTCGRGVNVYTGSGWGSETSLDRICHEIAYRRALQVLYPLTPSQQSFVSAKLDELRLALARDLLHRLVHRKPLKATLWRRLWRTDPGSFTHLLPNLARALLQRA